MDENRVEGAARNVGGELEDAVGRLTGDASTQARGKVDQAAGQAQNAYGQLADGVRDFTSDQPLVALIAAVGIGAILGFIIARR
jgi:uncharacterized protein YjbJ (UPF0337 family)